MRTARHDFDPVSALARVRHEFGEHGGVNRSIEASTTFTVLDPRTMPEIFAGHRTPDRDGCYLYGRHYNPTVVALARELAALESTEAAYCTASGMGAISAALLQLTDSGDHIVCSRAVYGGTWALLHDFFPKKTGVATTFVDARDARAVEAAFTPRTRVLYVETLSNPTLEVADLPRLARQAHAHGAALVVDNTFCPLLISPARHGADVVLHSLTKFVNGASDLIAGAICGSGELVARLMDLHTGALMLCGPTLDARAAFEVSMRLPHLPLRMAEHGRRALALCRRLEERGVSVCYPGLPSHPQHELFTSLLNPDLGYGGMFTLDVRFGLVAVSLGYAETLLSCSAASTSSELDDAALGAAGISPGLVRVSLGFTGSLEERWAQLAAGLDEIDALG
jgi:methionine-gamma-lyase